MILNKNYQRLSFIHLYSRLSRFSFG